MLNNLDKLDLNLLYDLQKDGRISSTEVAEKGGSSRPTVTSRVKLARATWMLHAFSISALVFILVVFSGMFYFKNQDIYPMVSAQTNEEYVGPEYCKSCHPYQYDEWNTTKHSQAYSDPAFREQWEEEGRPGECLECHTTGYDLSKKTYEVEGVTCEVCHGPKNTMSIDISKEQCQQCHTGTTARQIELGTHGMGGVSCVQCHMYQQSHTFKPRAEACAQCHTETDIHIRSEIPDLRSQVSELGIQIPTLEANITQLLAELEEQQIVVKRVETTYTYLLYGGVVAAVLVIGGIISFTWRRPR